MQINIRYVWLVVQICNRSFCCCLLNIIIIYRYLDRPYVCEFTTDLCFCLCSLFALNVIGPFVFHLCSLSKYKNIIQMHQFRWNCSRKPRELHVTGWKTEQMNGRLANECINCAGWCYTLVMLFWTIFQFVCFSSVVCVFFFFFSRPINLLNLFDLFYY